MANRLTDDPRLRSLLLASAMAMFAIQLDFFAVQAALPAIAAEFDTTTTALQWVISGYMLALASFLIVGGRLADLLGRRTWLLLGAVVFGAASLVGGAATGPEMLIAARIVQGVGAAVLMPVCIAVVTNAFPTTQTQRAVGLVFGIAAVGQALGPLVGGALTGLLSWRVVLWVNVPVSALIILLTMRSVEQSRDETAPRVIDWAGLCLIVASVATLTYGIDRASDWGWLSLPTFGFVLAGVVGFAALLVVERRARFPLVDLQLFKIREFTVMILAGVVGNVGIVVSIFLSMVYLQNVEDYSPTEAGLAFLVFSGGATIAAQLSGRMERFPSWAVMDVALLVGGIGAIGMGLNVDNVVLYLVFSLPTGAGFGMCWSFASVVTQSVVAPEKAGAASGVVLTALIGFGGVAIAAASSIVVTRAGQSTADLGGAIGDVLIGVGILAVCFIAVVTVLGRRQPADTGRADASSA